MCVRKETFPGRRKSIQAGHKHGHSSRSSLQSSSYRRHTTSPPWSLSYKWSHLIFTTTIQPAVMFLFRACVPHIDDDDFIISLHAFCFFRVLCLLWYYICTCYFCINIYSGILYSQWCTKNGLQGVDFTKYQVVCCPKRETIIDKGSGVGMALTWDSSQTFFYVLGCIPK